MNASELKYQVESHKHDSKFFSRGNMRFAGDTMRNYGVRTATIHTLYDANDQFVGKQGVDIEVWELYRKNPVKHGLQKSAFFDKVTFRQRFEFPRELEVI